MLLLSLGGYAATFTASAADASQAMCPTFPTLPNDSPTFPTFPGPPSIPVVTTPNVAPCTTTTTTTPSTTTTTPSTTTATTTVPVTTTTTLPVTTTKTTTTTLPVTTTMKTTVTTTATQQVTTTALVATTTPGSTTTTSVVTPGVTTTKTTTAPFTAPVKKKVSKPAISIVKDPKSQTVASGGTATFDITVKNKGNVTLTDVTVTDPLSAGCDRSVGTLAAGASTHYTCTATGVEANFENTATVTGNPPTGAPVTATDHANVKVKVAPLTPPKKPKVVTPKKKVVPPPPKKAPFTPPKPPVQKPRIAIVKDPKLQSLTTKIVTTKAANGAANRVVTYGTAQFTIKVTNTGNTVLDSVTVADAMSPDCDHSIGTLARGGSSSFSCTSQSVKRNFTNVAIATGESPNGTKVTASDDAKVVVTVVPTTSVQPAKFTG